MKRIISLIIISALLLSSVLMLGSCEAIGGVLDSLVGSVSGDGSGDPAKNITLDGVYIPIGSTLKLTFKNKQVTVKMGSRSMSGSYRIASAAEDKLSIIFDFGDVIVPIRGIGSGTYPFAMGNQGGADYILLFGERFDKQ